MDDIRRFKAMGPMGLVAMLAASVSPEALDRLLPEPEPKKQPTPDDHARILAAAERRAKRNAKHAKKEPTT